MKKKSQVYVLKVKQFLNSNWEFDSIWTNEVRALAQTDFFTHFYGIKIEVRVTDVRTRNFVDVLYMREANIEGC